MRFNCLKLFSLLWGLIFFAVADLQAQQVVRVYMSGGRTIVYDGVDSLVCTVEEQEIYADGKIYRFLTSEVDSAVYNLAPVTPGQQVDLGLSVKWAGWNVGATSPEEYGGYFAWGELEEKSDYSVDTYQYYDQANKAYQFIGDNISGTQYDVARTQWGDNWRMPTKEEFQELVDRCDWEWAKYNGVSGQKITGPNGNSIFLPAAGYRHGQHFSYRGSDGHYWMGDFYRDDSKNAYFLYFYYGYEHWNYDYRFDGFSVRPVFDEIKHEF